MSILLCSFLNFVSFYASTKLYSCHLCQSYIANYAVFKPCNHAILCYECGKSIKKPCSICAEEVSHVEKAKHGLGNIYKCPVNGCNFSCPNSLTELLNHIKESRHFRVAKTDNAENAIKNLDNNSKNPSTLTNAFQEKNGDLYCK